MSELKTLLDQAARAKSQGIVTKSKAEAPTPEPAPLGAKPKVFRRRHFFISALIALLLISVGFYLYRRNSNDMDTESLVAAVGKLVTLPSDAMPTVATVTDPTKLSAQAFFKDAKTGDKVLIYADAGKAILYRPSEHKIIAIGPLLQ